MSPSLQQTPRNSKFGCKPVYRQRQQQQLKLLDVGHSGQMRSTSNLYSPKTLKALERIVSEQQLHKMMQYEFEQKSSHESTQNQLLQQQTKLSQKMQPNHQLFGQQQFLQRVQQQSQHQIQHSNEEVQQKEDGALTNKSFLRDFPAQTRKRQSTPFAMQNAPATLNLR